MLIFPKRNFLRFVLRVAGADKGIPIISKVWKADSVSTGMRILEGCLVYQPAKPASFYKTPQDILVIKSLPILHDPSQMSYCF